MMFDPFSIDLGLFGAKSELDQEFDNRPMPRLRGKRKLSSGGGQDHFSAGQNFDQSFFLKTL